MQIFTVSFLVFAIGVVVGSTSPPGGKPRRAPSWYVVGEEAAERDAIYRSLLEAHPQWSRKQLYEAAQPLVAAAGIPPSGYKRFLNQISIIRREINGVRPYHRLTQAHVTLLEEEFLWDPTQSIAKVWTKMRDIWGDETPSIYPVTQWWAAAKRNQSRSPSPSADTIS